MRKKRVLINVLNTDRKILYMILSIVIVSVLTLTVVYAALSTTLNINGQAEVNAASWDIYLDNVQLNSNSATTIIPTIANKTTASFSTTLSKPGDFYEFTVDVVNNGSIDAMIDSVTKTPELSDTQKKHLNYIIEYENGEAITTKQLVSKNSLVRLKVKVEYRKDISSTDLPIVSETLDLSFTVNYVQSDVTGIGVKDNGILKPLMEFIVDGITYQAREGMTWGEWVDSDYNIGGFYFDDMGFVAKGSPSMQINSCITSEDVINANESYSLFKLYGVGCAPPDW